MRVLVFPALLCALFMPLGAATLASVDLVLPNQPIPPLTLLSTEQPFDLYYNLVVTGGTGTGSVLLDASLVGTSDETPGPHQYSFEGDAQLNITTSGSSSSVSTHDGHENLCIMSFDAGCFIPFTFGVSETVELSGNANAFFSTGTPNPVNLPSFMISASVAVDGIAATYADDPNVNPADIQTSFSQLPEPGSLGLAALAVLVIAAPLRRSTRKS